jgi:carbon storage regulator CsrA
MLVLTRKVGEKIVVPQCELTVTVLDASPGRVRLGIVAPASVVVHRSEVRKRVAVSAKERIEEAMMSVRRILIADPDEFLVSSYRECFSEFGAVVATAATGLACVKLLREFTPDVLILEPALPWGGADGVLAILQEEPAIRPASVILLASGVNRTQLYRLSPFRVDDFQTKPLSPRQLLERICSMRVAEMSGVDARPICDIAGCEELTVAH